MSCVTHVSILIIQILIACNNILVSLEKSARISVQLFRSFDKFWFLRNGTSARLMRSEIACSRQSERSTSGPEERKSSPRPLSSDRRPDGMEQKPYESRPSAMGRGPQGKATVRTVLRQPSPPQSVRRRTQYGRKRNGDRQSCGPPLRRDIDQGARRTRSGAHASRDVHRLDGRDRACITWSGKWWTTPWTKRWPATATRSTSRCTRTTASP